MVAAWPRRAVLTQVLLVGPALLQPFPQQAGGEIVQGAGPAGRDQAAAGGVGVGEEDRADGGAAAGRVDAGQGDDEPACRGDGSGDRVVDVVLAQRLEHGDGGPVPDLDPVVGLRKITPSAAQNANRDRSATRALWRCDPCSERRKSSMSLRVTSRRWS